MEFTVENISGLLMRSKLLNPDEVRNVYQRWLAEGKEKVANSTSFLKWMVANNYLTEYQAALISRGHADDFFLGQYKILERLGKGRMAGVYKAAHELGQVVAIKVLPPSKAKEAQFLARFQREARLSMRLKHPNIVRSFQIGESRGLHYLVMEYLEGETLDEVVQRRKKLPPQEAVRLAYQVLQGLQHIHEQGLVHRDVKPANLMLVTGGKRNDKDNTLQSIVKILDIGLGREFFDENTTLPPDGADIQLTGEGVLLGTPDYLAPEQARDPRSIDTRADIYSLGCVLYHMLTGQPPFPDKSVISQMVRHATEEPKPVKQFSPEVADGLQQILNWMLAKKPEQRYPTPVRAAQALQVYMVSGAEARPIEDAPQMRKFITFLEMGDKSGADEPKPAAPVIAPPPRMGLPANAPAPPTAKPVPTVPMAMPAVPAAEPVRKAPVAKEKEKSGREQKKPPLGKDARQKKKKTPTHGVPVAAIAPIVAVPAGGSGPVPATNFRPEDIDVELVPAPAPGDAAGATRSGFGLSRRDWIIFGIGALVVLAAVVLGFGLAQLSK
jgi:serine/threonine protein kinase